MSFWTSKEPGVLPKWVFWFYALQIPLYLSLAPLGSGSSIAASTALLMAFSARWNEIRLLLFMYVMPIVGVPLFLWSDVKHRYLDISSGALTLGYLYFLVMAWYLNRYRSKGETSPLAPSTPELNDPAEDVAATADRQVASVETDNAPDDDYAIELKLYEAGDLDESLWAKHLVEVEGDVDKAKWKYIKERVATAPARRLDEHRAIHNAAIDAYLEKEQAGHSQHPSGRGWQLAGLAFLVFIVFVIGFG